MNSYFQMRCFKYFLPLQKEIIAQFIFKQAWNLEAERRPGFKEVRKILENLQGRINSGLDSPTS